MEKKQYIRPTIEVVRFGTYGVMKSFMSKGTEEQEAKPQTDITIEDDEEEESLLGYSNNIFGEEE